MIPVEIWYFDLKKTDNLTNNKNDYNDQSTIWITDSVSKGHQEKLTPVQHIAWWLEAFYMDGRDMEFDYHGMQGGISI